MKIFGQLIRTAVNVAVLPVVVAVDVVKAPFQVMTGDADEVGEKTKEQLEKIKDEASEQ